MGGDVISIFDNDVSLANFTPSLLNEKMDKQIAFNFVDYLADINFISFHAAKKISENLMLFTGVAAINYGEFNGTDVVGNSTSNFNSSQQIITIGSSKNISNNFVNVLKLNGLEAKIVGREKSPFSIWRKIQSKRISLEQLTDVIGFRIIVKDFESCYKVLGIFHSKWSAIPGKFKDYISTPKINNYKSIHTAIIGPNKERMQIQIRTKEMHEFAERGIASHWIYKSSEKISHLALKEYDWLRDLVEIMEKDASPEHFLEYTKLQMFQENVFCFTPKGEVIKLPRGATPIDFAYAVHTKLGDTLNSCKINGRGSPLQSILKNGDLVKIIGSKNDYPSLLWLSYAKTGKARASIRRYWQIKKNIIQNTKRKYVSGLCIKIPNLPGKLGEVSSLIGFHENNIINMEIIAKKTDYLEFIFDIQIKDLKNYRNLLSELKLKEYKFRIIRHRKKDAFLRRIFKNFKRN